MRPIDADALRASFKSEIGEHFCEFGGWCSVFKDALRIIDKTPTIDPERLRPRWIPVAERLPEKYEDVLITYRITEEKAARIWIGYRAETGWCAYGIHNPNVMAWMQMPEPYEPNDDEQEE